MEKVLARDQSIATRLGWVSFFNDCSSEVIARALPLLLTAGLGVSPTFVGAVEGAAEAVSIFLKGFSGWWSDLLPSRKPLVFFGYFLSLLSRVALLGVQLPWIFGLARIFDRTGKGLRSAPRDAMIADAAATGMTGAAFGVTRFLDTLGAITGIGVVLALGLGEGQVTAAMFRQLVWVAIPFGVVSLLVLAFAVPKLARMTKAKKSLAWHIPKEARGYLAAVAIFALGNSSDAFLVLRASQLGYSFRGILGLMLAFNVLSAGLALPIGSLTDRIGRKRVLALGWSVYAVAYALFGYVQSQVWFALALFLYGAFYGFTEGTEKALLADLLPPEKRGIGFGALQLVLGVVALPASLLTGWLMTNFGGEAAFRCASMLALLGLMGLGLWSFSASRMLTEKKQVG